MKTNNRQKWTKVMNTLFIRHNNYVDLFKISFFIKLILPVLVTKRFASSKNSFSRKQFSLRIKKIHDGGTFA